MSAGIAYLLVVGVLLAAAARAGEEVLRLARRPTRHAWAGALALLLVLAARAALTGPAEAALPIQAPLVVDASGAGTGGDPSRWTSARALLGLAKSAVAGAPGAVVARVGSLVPTSPSAAAAAVWATMSTAVLLLLVLTYWRFSRAVRSLPAVTLHGTPVRVSPAEGPAVVGMRDPQVVVPAWLLEAPEAEQRLVITHEREHLAARDPQLLVAACLAAVAMPWHPAVWWMLSRLRLAVEMDCDARVLAAGTPRRLYGTTLIDIAARGSRLPLGAPALADHTTHLERRLMAMTTTSTSFRRSRLLAVSAAAFLTVAAACEARLPSAPEIEAMDAAAVERNVLTKAALAGDSITWYVDGRVVAAEEARAVAASYIASVEVKKGPMRSEIRILTKADSAAVQEVYALSKSGERLNSVPPKTVRELRPLSSSDYAGLIFIDGQAATQQEMAALSPQRIESMEVLKGSAARKIYDDPRAEKGVIRVTTKR